MIPTGQGDSSDKPTEEGKLPTTTSHLHDHLSDEEKRLSEFVERKFPEWKDDKSMLFYMTNFKKSRQININDWDTRLKFWRNVLLSIISEFYKNSILIVTIGQMKTFMSRRKKSDEGIVETTLGWQTVIQQMIHDGDLISINEFKKVYDISNNQGITSWLVDVATTWFFGRPSSLTNTGSDVAVNNTKIHEDSQYIVMKPLKEITYNFIRNAVKNHVTNVDLYFCPSELRETHFPDYDFGQLDLLLRYMHCEEAAYVIEISNSKKGVVCFEESANKKTFLKQGEMSSQKAAGIIQLKETSCLLKKEVSSLELKVESLLSQAKEYLTKGKRDEAKWILKKKKLVGTILEKRNAALHNVFELLSSIENSTSDIEVVKSLSVGASTLKQFNTELNAIQDESLENIAEALSDYKEIKNIIDSGMEEMNKIQGLEFDEEELSKELERMEMEPTSSEKKQPTTPQKENSSSKTPSENNKTEEPTSTFPTSDDLPTDSFAVLEYERDNSTNEEIKEFCALKLKMLNLKKKMNKFKPLEVVPKLQQKILQLEKQQQELKKKGDSVGCKKIDIYLSLLLTEIESFTETEEVQKEKVPVLN